MKPAEGSPIIVALDYPSADEAIALARQLSPQLCRVKVGKELFTAAGPQLVEQLQSLGFDVFLDLKFHDIPNTVAGAVRAAAQLGVWMVNVHAGGGRRMLEAAVASLENCAHRPLLIGVTVLTSMSDEDLQELGYSQSAQERVAHLAALTANCSLDGVVCSAQEAPQLRQTHGPNFALVTPGIRLAGDAAGDQRRIVTPVDAMAQGASHLVIGRSITQAEAPLAVLETIHSDLTLSS